MTKEKDGQSRLRDNKAIIIGISLCVIAIVGMTVLFSWGMNQVQQNKADHYQSAIKETYSYQAKDCNDLVSYLKNNYFLAPDNNTDWYNYLDHVYNKLHDLGCSGLPTPNPDIEKWYN